MMLTEQDKEYLMQSRYDEAMDDILYQLQVDTLELYGHKLLNEALTTKNLKKRYKYFKIANAIKGIVEKTKLIREELIDE